MSFNRGTSSGFLLLWLICGIPCLSPTCGEEVEIPLGYPSILKSGTPKGDFEVSQRLIPFPFVPPDVKLKKSEALSKENNWFVTRDKRKIDELGMMNFYAESGRGAVAVVPKLHNTSAGIEIYRIPENSTKSDFEQKEGPFRKGITKLYSNRRTSAKLAKFKMGSKAESGIAYFYVSRILGKLVEVPPTTYRTMGVDEFNRIAKQAKVTGNRYCTYSWKTLREGVASKNPQYVLPDNKFVYGSLSENVRGENSSPPDYWTVSRIQQKKFYKTLSSTTPVSKSLDLDSPDCLQDLVLAQDLTRGVVLDEIFRQIDRLGNISLETYQHYINYKGIVKWNDNLDDADKSEAVSRFIPLNRIVYKDNDDGMKWSKKNISVNSIYENTHHLDPVLYQRIQWLSGLMQDNEKGTAKMVERYFLEVAHLKPSNYVELQKSIISVASDLKNRVENNRIQLDLNFEQVFKNILLNEITTKNEE